MPEQPQATFGPEDYEKLQEMIDNFFRVLRDWLQACADYFDNLISAAEPGETDYCADADLEEQSHHGQG